jgi:hypothetical protein
MTVAMLYDQEKQKGNANRATLTVADPRQQNGSLDELFCDGK